MPSGVAKTPHRTIRVPGELWDAVGVKAGLEGRTRTDETRRLPEWVPDPGQFSSRLAVLRHAMGWNMKEAAIACRIAPQSWREWEDGMRLPRNYEDACRKISDRTDCDLVWLMTGYIKPGTPLLLPRLDSNQQPSDSISSKHVPATKETPRERAA